MDRFFQIIRRINQLIILFLLVAGLVLATFIVNELFLKRERDKPTVNVVEKDISVNTTDAPVAKKVLELRNFKKIRGTDLFSYDVSESYDAIRTGPYGSSLKSVHRNTLFISSKDHKTHLLLPSYSYAILDHESISYALGESNDPRSRELNYYKILKKDLNSDGQLDADEKISLYFSRFNGAEMIEVLSDIDTVLSIEFIDPTKVSVLYNKNGQVYSAFFTATNFSMVGDETLIDLDPSR